MSYFKTADKKDCCGCTSCVQSCPVHAIHFEKDNEGFEYPVIDRETCIDCGLCERVCPVANPKYENSESPDVYAALLSDVNQLIKSSSGGVFYAIAKWVIDRGGIVFGATIDEHNQVRHISAENEDELQALRGSKYVQSALNETFNQVKESLKQGRLCYFVGTGCQVAGLYAYLRKKYDTLITSDLVCHGVPSQWLFDKHIDYLERKYHGVVSDYRFRNNAIGGGCELFKLATPKGKVRELINPTYNLSPYLYSFMYAMTYRYSCYDCKFAKVPRQGDITLADFWGSKEFFPEMDNSKGISLCLVNTEQGRRIWDIVKDKCEYRSSNVEDAAKYNGNLVHTSSPHPNRSFVYKKIKDEGYDVVAKNEFRIEHYNRVLLNLWINKSRLLSNLVKGMSRLKHKVFGQ